MVEGDDQHTPKSSGSFVTSSSGDKPQSPYYLHASDNPGALICSVILDGTNYSEWAVEMHNALQAKQKLGFIDGTIAKPTEGVELTMWMTNNSMIIGWIRTSMTPKIRSSITFVPEAYTLWDKLRRLFATTNGVRENELEGDIANCKQDGKSVLEYFSRLENLWEEMKTYRSKHNCTCGAADRIEKDYEKSKVHKFLLGLDKERFGSIRTQIIIGDHPLPDLNTVYNCVVREENHYQYNTRISFIMVSEPTSVG